MGRPRSKTIWVEFDNHFVATLKHGDTFISKESYNAVKDFKWFTKLSKCTNKYYVYAHLSGNKKILLHRHVMDVCDERFVDHINGDPLDNRLQNLRIASALENNRNVKKRKNCKSRYKGVTLRPSGRWGVYIKTENNNICLGTFDSEKEAALVYNIAAIEYFGEFAKLNNLEEE